MSPVPRDASTRRRLQRQRRRDTAPELAIRRELHRRGLRYFVDRGSVVPRRRHDIVFPSLRLAVDVYGCFWHSCPLHGTVPKSNQAWWEAKLAANVERDADTRRRLESAGWRLIVVWEHDDPVAASDMVAAVIDQARAGVAVKRTISGTAGRRSRPST